MSPVRWRLNSSIGIIWLYPPPAAPPLIPKVGPWLGWRMHVNTFLPRYAPRPWLSPTVVVVFPSPKGVGVIAVTTMYLPFGTSLSRSRTERCTLALVLPYSSNSSGSMPASAAIRSMGIGVAAWAISMSLGTGTRRFVNLWGTEGYHFLTDGFEQRVRLPLGRHGHRAPRGPLR